LKKELATYRAAIVSVVASPPPAAQAHPCRQPTQRIQERYRRLARRNVRGVRIRVFEVPQID
jgi:hypothetical protein